MDSSVDLEDVLLKHEAVLEVAVIAIDDPRWQEQLAIFRVKRGQLLRRATGRIAQLFTRQSGQILGA